MHTPNTFGIRPNNLSQIENQYAKNAWYLHIANGVNSFYEES